MMICPETVVFDFGGTLFDDHFDVRAGHRRMLELAGSSGVTIEEYAAVAAELDRELIPRRDSVMLEYPAQAFHRLLRDRLGLSYEEDDARLELEFWKAAETCTPRPELFSTLLALRRRGVRLAIISNMTFSRAVIEYELTKTDLLGMFDLVVTSADYCVRKPHPLIFLGVLGRLGVDPREAWYVGDRLEIDVFGANSVGMHSVWINPSGAVPSGDVVPSVQIAALSQLAALFSDAEKGRG